MKKNKCKGLLAVVMLLIILLIGIKFSEREQSDTTVEQAKPVVTKQKKGLIINDEYKWPQLDVELLTVNPYSRPGYKLEEINNIVIHYVANPGSSALANRNYFETLAVSKDTKASSHFVVGLEGEIVQCIPLTEIAYASNHRNNDTVAIEVCHPDDTGKFSDTTYDKLIELCAWLCLRHGLEAEDLIRHYDVTGKNCPKYYVENEDAWRALKKDVEDEMKNYPIDNEV